MLGVNALRHNLTGQITAMTPTTAHPTTPSRQALAFIARCDFIVTHNVRHLRVAERFGIGVVTLGGFLGTIGVKP